ncbi:MAG: TraR/DksA C4-type zinc finger protein [Syntrophobacteraceae bacterium]|nr:TraR/DksA C4-type zinc finger protein [Syntrophobacteraceae bacterium]
MMTKDEVVFLKNMLVDRRNGILERVQRLAAAWQELEEPAIELEEEAQKANIVKPYDKLDESRKTEIEQIDLALIKMSVGDYGICESCGDDIAPKRLQVLPWARLCVECARDLEKRHGSLPQTMEVAISGKIPEEYQDLGAQQIIGLIYERLQNDERIETEELRVSFKKGVVALDGRLGSESERELVLHLISDSMGFSSVVDRIEVNESGVESDEISEGVSGEEESGGLFYDQEMSEEAFEAQGMFSGASFINNLSA